MNRRPLRTCRHVQKTPAGAPCHRAKTQSGLQSAMSPRQNAALPGRHVIAAKCCPKIRLGLYCRETMRFFFLLHEMKMINQALMLVKVHFDVKRINKFRSLDALGLSRIYRTCLQTLCTVIVVCV